VAEDKGYAVIEMLQEPEKAPLTLAAIIGILKGEERHR